MTTTLPTSLHPMPADDVDMYMHGQCAAFAAAHQEVYPHLQFGLHLEQLSEEDSMREADENGDEWDGERIYRVQHVFTHDDQYAYDAEGAHPMPFNEWDDSDFQVSFREVELTGMLEPGYMPERDFIIKYAAAPVGTIAVD